jgi:hypothetical protein
MATGLTTNITLQVQAQATDTAVTLPDGSNPSANLNFNKKWSWANGNALQQANAIYMKRHLISTGTPLALDLAGTLIDILGNTITMSKVCAIIVVNNSATAAEITTVGAGSNPLLNWIIATGDGNKAGPGGAVVVIDESAAAYAVTAGTGDVLQISVAAGTNVSHDVIIIGRT